MFLKWIKMGIPPFEENLYPSSARIVLERSNALKVGLDKCSCDAVAEAGFLGEKPNKLQHVDILYLIQSKMSDMSKRFKMS